MTDEELLHISTAMGRAFRRKLDEIWQSVGFPHCPVRFVMREHFHDATLERLVKDSTKDDAT